MALAAVTCLRDVIRRLLHSSHVSLASPTRTNLESAYDELFSLQELVKRSGRSNMFKDLDLQIVGVVHELQDSLELYELQSRSYGDEEYLVHAITSFVEKVKEIRTNVDHQLLSEEKEEDEEEGEEEGGGEGEEEKEKKRKKEKEEEEGEEEEDEDDDGCSSNMVGLTDGFQPYPMNIQEHFKEHYTYVFWIVGMAGIGKTALAERIYESSPIRNAFKCWAFVKIGQKYKLEEMKRSIMDQLNPNCGQEEEEESLDEYLNDKRYLIVLDDVWSLSFWDDFFKDRRGDYGNGSCIIVTTRIQYLAKSLANEAYFYMPFLNEQESWDLLCIKVFSSKVCPRELEKAGKEIAKKCDGLPLTIVTVADILLKSGDLTEEFWNEVAHQQNSVFEDAYNQILDILYPSYYNLPPHAKTCFLYMGAFPPEHQVRRSNLVNLWSAEGFLESKDSSFPSKCFDDLTFHHVAVPSPHISSDGQTYKACALHSVFRHLCRKELRDNEFLHILDRHEEDFTLDGKRRLSIYYNVLLGIRVVEASSTHESPPMTRSLLCTGVYHPYEVSIDFNLRLLKVCDALTIRFYEFPSEVLELVQLRYLAITCNKNIPPLISKLLKIEYLIVHQHLSIKSTVDDESFLPVEIWDLQELKHLQIPGRNLPNPPSKGVVLPNIVTLLDVGIPTCTQAVLESTPNLEKLRVGIEMTPNSSLPLIFSDHISCLSALKSLQFVVKNPILMSKVVVPPPGVSFDPSSITKLFLSGLGYPWHYLNRFAKWPHLKVLKLRDYAFQGEEWEVEEMGFVNLECLVIEDSNIQRWKIGNGALTSLHYLTLKSCYRLQELPNIPSVIMGWIELVDSHSAALTWALETGTYVSHSWDAAPDSKDYIHNRNYNSCIYYT